MAGGDGPGPGSISWPLPRQDGVGPERDLAVSEGRTAPFPSSGQLAIHHRTRLPQRQPLRDAWYRRTFILPGSPAGSRIKLRFGGVKFDGRVWVNGVFVGGCLNGYDPFELDITQAALVGKDNELVVGLTDWTATFAQPVDFNDLAPYENLTTRRIP